MMIMTRSRKKNQNKFDDTSKIEENIYNQSIQLQIFKFKTRLKTSKQIPVYKFCLAFKTVLLQV